MTTQPINVNPYFKEAQEWVKKLASVVDITFAALDDWNTNGTHGPRIIYGGDFVESCGSKCGACTLFQMVGEDLPGTEECLRASLCVATKEQNDLFPSQQFYLNCKTLEQYLEAFIRWTVEKCLSPDELKAELAWIAGFRILLLHDSLIEDELKNREHLIKRRMIEEITARLEKRRDMRRQRLTIKHARLLGIY